MNEKTYDIVIVGAGPSGCAYAYQLRKTNLKIALIDKGSFPKDKICGDALSADVINQFYRMDEKLAQKFEDFTEKLPSNGVRFFAPNQQKLDIDFTNSKFGKSAGYISKRRDFDNFFFEQIKNLANVDVFLNNEVKEVTSTDHHIIIKTDKIKFHSKLAIGADGAHSVLNKKLTTNKIEKDHYSAGLRQYFTGVTGFHPENHIELHFYDDVLPGYFWIFPLPNGQANVGLGILSSEVSKKGIKIKDKLNDIVNNHPNVKDRFKNAKPTESIQGFGLPLGSKKRPISGNRFLLLGDAASLIDPFSGEGIGNAIRSGRIAADHTLKAFDQNKFDTKFNKAYDKEVYHKMWKELRVSRSMQKLLNYPKLFNFIVKKANKNESIRTLLTSMLDNIDLKKELTKPSFYFKLIFN